LLTGEQRFVHEVLGSRSLKERDTVLARVIDIGDLSVFCGMYPRSLSPLEADSAVRTARRVCGVRTRPITAAKLRDGNTTLQLIHAWRVAVDKRDNRPLPQLANTDGDPLLLTADHFEFDAEQRERIVSMLCALEGAQRGEDEDSTVTVSFLRPGTAKIKNWDNTIIGHAVIALRKLRIETNSIKRADALRKTVTDSLGALLRPRLREHEDVERLMAEARKAPPRQNREPPPELQAAAREFRERYMEQWCDDQIPALGGLTPREAAKSKASRAKLDLLLRDLEHRDGHLPAGERTDFRALRDNLGIE
jgi:hypothetical protein